MKFLGKGSKIDINIPVNPEYNKLYLINMKDDISSGTFEALNVSNTIDSKVEDF